MGHSAIALGPSSIALHNNIWSVITSNVEFGFDIVKVCSKCWLRCLSLLAIHRKCSEWQSCRSYCEKRLSEVCQQYNLVTNSAKDRTISCRYKKTCGVDYYHKHIAFRFPQHTGDRDHSCCPTGTCIASFSMLTQESQAALCIRRKTTYVIWEKKSRFISLPLTHHVRPSWMSQILSNTVFLFEE